MLLSFLFLLIFFHPNCASRTSRNVSLDPTSQKFIDLVRYIILPVEEKIFREMPAEDRGEFIKDFWARRDPDPSTLVNEFRETYYSRRAVADKAFQAGQPGWLTDRGRIFILLGPPTQVITKAMGDVPYEKMNRVTADLQETGTVTERPTEIWIYDSYPDYFKGPLRLVFVDFYSTGDYKLTSNVEITPYSMVSPAWEKPDLAKFQLIAKMEMDKSGLEAVRIFDYDASIIKITSDKNQPQVSLSIEIPFASLSYHKEGDEYSCDLTLTADVVSAERLVIFKKTEGFSRRFSRPQLLEAIKNNLKSGWDWTLALDRGHNNIYVSVVDNIKGKRLRKLLTVRVT